MKIAEIEEYIKKIADDELRYKNPAGSTAGSRQDENQSINFIKLFNIVKIIVYSIFDFAQLYLKVRFGGNSFKNKNIVYTTEYFCHWVDGKLTDRVLKPLQLDNVVYINTSREKVLVSIDNQKVYNIGGLARVLSFFYLNKNGSMRGFLAFTAINDLIIRNLKGNHVFMTLFYNVNGLSLVFSKFRKHITLIEVQHGSMVNYPPYAKPAPIRIADVFYVKNQPTIEYLKIHLCLNFPAEYRLLPYPQQKRELLPGIHFLYASTVEFNGLHPVLKQFLTNFQRDDFYLIIRLHPREKDKETLFVEQMKLYKTHYRFDHSENWLDGTNISNLVVVSPWSSIIEDAYDNGFQTIIIDPLGRERYQHLIDNQRCFYSDNLLKTTKYIVN